MATESTPGSPPDSSADAASRPPVAEKAAQGSAAGRRFWLAFGFLARLALGGLFIYASLDKLFHPAVFADIISNYQLLPGSLVSLLAVVLPWAELITGGLLVIGLLTESSALLLGFFSLVFTGAVTAALVRGLDITCGCFTVSETADNVAWSHLAVDLGLLALAVVVLAVRPRLLALDRLFERGRS
jgi:uncharacterized membrane protein YphA (DoxX/SURF4 family)